VRLSGIRTFRHYDFSPPGRFAPSLDVSPSGRFVLKTFRTQDVSLLDASPLAWTFCSFAGHFAPHSRFSVLEVIS